MLEWRYLPWVLLTAVGGLLIGSSILVPSRTKADSSTLYRGSNHDNEKHYVHPRQLADANEMVQRALGDLSATVQDGRRVNWEELSGGRPVVLLFVKEGCPCSAEVEPFFQRVEKIYANEACFARLIDAGAKSAAHYAAEHRVYQPMLVDPEKMLIRQFRAKNGCYVVLLTPGGLIDGCWPGCSADTMRQLGRRIAGLTGVAERPLDTSGMPASLTNGCPFKF
jgi:hypothetical protein